ncbi:FHA domain-containing protein [bacterium]|nr:FHA domain-containing protein [bacterium]
MPGAGPAAKTPDLVVLWEGTERREPLRAEVSLGREPGNTLVLDDSYLSRRHCTVMPRGERVSIVDLKSYNGTYVNGQRIHEECFLAPGDVVRIGRTTLYIDWNEHPSESVHVLAPDQRPYPGVEPVVRAKAPVIAPAYKEATATAAPPPRSKSTAAAGGDVPTMGYTSKERAALREKKTPVPMPSVAESAIARKSGEGSSSGPTKPASTHSRDREGLRIIAQISRVLPSVEDETEFTDYAIGKVLEVVPAERGVVMRLDPSRKGLYMASVKNAVPGRDDQTAWKLGISHTIARKVIREKVSVLVDDAKVDERFREASSVQELELRSVLCVPIWLLDKVSGLIYLDHQMSAYMFTEADRELLVAVANLVALGITKGKK